MLAVLCAASLLPVISSGQVEQAVSTSGEKPPQTGRVHANGASVRQIGFRDESNRVDLNPAPGPNPARVPDSSTFVAKSNISFVYRPHTGAASDSMSELSSDSIS